MARSYVVKGKPKMEPAHPGAILRDDILPALALSVSEAARRLGVTRQHLHRILAETHPVTPEMALRLGKLIGNSAEFWLNLQQAVDLRLAEQRLADEIAAIEPAEAA